MNAVIYDIDTGKIKRSISCHPSLVADQIGNGEDFYLNCPDGSTHIKCNKPVDLSLPPTIKELLAPIRARRKDLLASSDWTQVADAPVNQQAWSEYRQQLRDFPESCDVKKPVWPVPPS